MLISMALTSALKRRGCRVTFVWLSAQPDGEVCHGETVRVHVGASLPQDVYHFFIASACSLVEGCISILFVGKVNVRSKLQQTFHSWRPALGGSFEQYLAELIFFSASYRIVAVVKCSVMSGCDTRCRFAGAPRR